MKKILFSLLFASTVFAGCTKSDEVQPSNGGTNNGGGNNGGGGGGGGTPTWQKGYGAIRFANNSTNRYEIFLDGGSLGVINPRSYYDKGGVLEGRHSVSAKQLEGYLFDPSVFFEYVDVTKDVSITLSFAE